MPGAILFTQQVLISHGTNCGEPAQRKFLWEPDGEAKKDKTSG